MRVPDDVRAKLNEASREVFKRVTETLGVDADELRLAGMYYDRAGTPIGLGDCIALQRDFSYVVVGRARVGPHLVSTVWLGLNYGFFGPPLIFETMVFNEASERTIVDLFGREHQDSEWDLQERYGTEEEALAGHERIVAHVEQVTGLTREESQ